MMALAGSPDGKEEYDSEMASSYLRLISDPSIENDSPEYMPKVSNAEERKVAKNVLWRKVSVRNRTRREI